ncbi:unnamed protein product [Strongylus vulgaris]|uniref:Uncharacterized protein n=1 Tax=Strongylus vulgaris TaxID=40348 RepID=A0A3P7J400_STRVU|nr:unnamed protein product [Strongylus vulgaris]
MDNSSHLPLAPNGQLYANLPPVSTFFISNPSAFHPYEPPAYEPYGWFTECTTPAFTETYNSTYSPQDHIDLPRPKPLYPTAYHGFIPADPEDNRTSFLPRIPSLPTKESTFGHLVSEVEAKEVVEVDLKKEEPKIDTCVEEHTIDVLIANSVPHKYFPAVLVQSMGKSRPFLLYNAPGTDRCYTFTHICKEGRFDVYFCNGCHEAKKEDITLLVHGNYFQSDPSRLPHVCSPKLLIEEISHYTKRKVKLPLKKYLLVQKVTPSTVGILRKRKYVRSKPKDQKDKDVRFAVKSDYGSKLSPFIIREVL